MCCKPNQCFITIEALTNSAQISLPQSNRIQEGRVTSIMLRRSGSATLKSYTGNTLASDAVIATAHIRLKKLDGSEVTSPIPLSSLQRDFNSPDPLLVDWKNIDLTQSQIVLDFSVATATHVVEVIFGLDCTNCN